MKIYDKIFDWLEINWVKFVYGGGLFGVLLIFFFVVVVNIMVGWLYLISVIIFVLLGVSVFLFGRLLCEIKVCCD